MSYEIIIKNGTVVTASETYQADIGIRDGIIKAIGYDLGEDALKLIKADHYLVLPGGIDVHVHFNNRVGGIVTEDFWAGTKAAASGGVTTIVDFAPQHPKKGLVQGIQDRIAEAKPQVCIDYAFHGMITHYDQSIGKEFETAIKLGVPSHKMYMTYRQNGWYSDDTQLYEALIRSRETGAMIMVHAESDTLLTHLIEKYKKEGKKLGAYAHALSRPNYIEAEAIQRAILWVEVTGGSLYVVHLSTREGADLIAAAKKKGIKVDTETCPQYLLLTEEVFKDKKRGHLFATCPQLKTAADNERLWKAIINNEINIIATDTCTFTAKQKARWQGDFTKIPYGMPGVETMIPVLYTEGVRAGRISINRLVELISTGPAKKMGLFPRKGTITIGSDADFLLINPHKKEKIIPKELATACDWSPYEGRILYGFPDYVLSRGNIVIEKGSFKGQKGQGTFIPRFLTNK